MIQKKIRLTEEEARFISTKVAESGMTNFNAFARIMLIMGEVKILNFEELRELRKEINRIGVNINQVAKKVNEDDQASLNELSQILELQKHLKNKKIKQRNKRDGCNKSSSDKRSGISRKIYKIY